MRTIARMHPIHPAHIGGLILFWACSATPSVAHVSPLGGDFQSPYRRAPREPTAVGLRSQVPSQVSMFGLPAGSGTSWAGGPGITTADSTLRSDRTWMSSPSPSIRQPRSPSSSSEATTTVGTDRSAGACTDDVELRTCRPGDGAWPAAPDRLAGVAELAGLAEPSGLADLAGLAEPSGLADLAGLAAPSEPAGMLSPAGRSITCNACWPG